MGLSWKLSWEKCWSGEVSSGTRTCSSREGRHVRTPLFLGCRYLVISSLRGLCLLMGNIRAGQEMSISKNFLGLQLMKWMGSAGLLLLNWMAADEAKLNCKWRNQFEQSEWDRNVSFCQPKPGHEKKGNEKLSRLPKPVKIRSLLNGFFAHNARQSVYEISRYLGKVSLLF